MNQPRIYENCFETIMTVAASYYIITISCVWIVPLAIYHGRTTNAIVWNFAVSRSSNKY